MMVELPNLEQVRMVFDLPGPVPSPTPNPLSMAVSFMCGLYAVVEKVHPANVPTIPQAQVSGLPPARGRGVCGPAFQPNGDTERHTLR